MANTFKNARLAVTSSNQTMYTNSSGGTALILTLRITNVDGATDDTVTAQIMIIVLQLQQKLLPRLQSLQIHQ